jgi:hypothetical protein
MHFDMEIEVKTPLGVVCQKNANNVWCSRRLRRTWDCNSRTLRRIGGLLV